MAYFYSDTEPKSGAPMRYHDADASKHYLTHFENREYLLFIKGASDDWREKRQCDRELEICERKLAYWKKHPNWFQSVVEAGIAKVKQNWAADKDSVIANVT